jgi:hypothetical protein
MKAIKFSVIAAIVAITMVSSTYADGIKLIPKLKAAVNLNIDQAIKMPGLVRAMYQQVTREQVIAAHQHVYVAKVYYEGKVYFITGTFDQWMRFFLMDGGSYATTQEKFRRG